MTMETEVMQCGPRNAKDFQEPTEAKKSQGKAIFWSFERENVPSDTLI